MKVNSLTLDNFRNIEHLELEPVEGVNIIYGENAQGKSNLLEGIWLFTGLRSFRGSKEKELVRFGQDFAKLQLSFNDDLRDVDATIDIAEKKTATLGGVSYGSCSKLCGEFLGIIFSPGHLSLVQGGPSERRKFINMALCQLKPKYASNLTQFNKILQQRNVLLKDITYHTELYDTLEIWDENLAAYSAYLIDERRKYLEELTPFLEDFYGGISGGRERINIAYSSGLTLESTTPAELKEEVLLSLKQHRREDILSGVTGLGPHRDDLDIRLDGIPVKNFGSQGQQRSCALSLKMSEAAIIKKITGKQPVALLDDVMSELDSHRQDYILNHIEGWQVFITCCEPSSILLSRKAENGKMFEIQGGKLCSST